MSESAARLAQLRTVLAQQGYSGIIVPLTDEHMSEYVGAYANRLEFLTNFSGSAGLAIVTADKAAMFTDGRYTIQVREQVDGSLYSYETFDDQRPADWLRDAVSKGDRIAYDGELLRLGFREKLEKAVARKGASLAMTDANLIDLIWTDQPAVPLTPLVPHDTRHAGENSQEKRTRLGEQLRTLGADAAPIMMLDSIAWLLNIRGGDVTHTPVARAAALLDATGHVDLFVEDEKITDAVRAHLGNGVTLHPRDHFYPALENLSGKQVLFDPETHNCKMHDLLLRAGAVLVKGADPCILPKAVKNDVEQEGTIQAHIRDGVAVTRYLHWLSKEAATGALDELACVDKLWQFRQDNPLGHGLLKDSSFDTISGAGPNGAMCHYRVTSQSNRALDQDSLYLCDSGGQYLDGTTDITRTIAVGTPSPEMCANFTRVLRGHIALAMTVFARGTSGHALDSIARRPLWEVGLDYDHGTGHGVGSFLGVHEGPQRIAKFGSAVPLEPGMILSNEPGYYKTDEYGIRIENLILVKPWCDANGQESTDMLCFHTLTLAPIDPRLIQVDMMSADEIGWLNRYHARVFEAVSPHLDEAADADVLAWLKSVTSPLTASLAA